MPDKPAHGGGADAKTTHDALLAKMEALVGRHRTDSASATDDIPVLTDVVAVPGNEHTTTTAASSKRIAQTVNVADEQALRQILEDAVIPTLTRHIREQTQAQLEAHIAAAVRQVLAREAEQFARSIAQRVEEILREQLDSKR
jgi:hypothetical protein